MMDEKHIAIMQPYFFPYIGYWQLINAADTFVVYDDGAFIDSVWICRNRILNHEGTGPMNFGIRVSHGSHNKIIYQVERTDIEWVSGKLMKTLAERYKRAPHYNEVIEVIRPLILNPEKNLSRYLTCIIKGVASYLGIKTDIHLSTEVSKEGLEHVDKKVARICDHFGIHNYINPIGGMQFYDKAEWAANGVNIQFLKRNDDIRYRQFYFKYVPDLSIIDIMMFCSREEIGKLLNEYTLL